MIAVTERRRKKTPRMDGVLDWFFGKRSPEEQPRSIFESFGAIPPGEPPAAPLPGLPAPQGSGLPILRPETPSAVRPSMFDVFLPVPPTAAGSGGMIPAEATPAGPLIFRSFAPTPPAPPMPETEQQPELFTPEPERPFGSFFELFEPSAEVPSFRAGEYSHGIPLWDLTSWRMPTTWEIHEEVVRNWDPNFIFETVLSETGTQYWKRAVEESTHYGPATIEIDRVARKNSAFEDFAGTFQIPRQVLDLYFGNVTTEADAQEASERFMEEVLNPLIDRYEKVFDLLKPTRELRGWFEFARDRETGDWWLTYREAKYRPQLGCRGRRR